VSFVFPRLRVLSAKDCMLDSSVGSSVFFSDSVIGRPFSEEGLSPLLPAFPLPREGRRNYQHRVTFETVGESFPFSGPKSVQVSGSFRQSTSS